MSSILISITIPTYNRPSFVRERLREIVPQLDGECELLFVDNASQQPVSDLVEEMFPQGHPSVRVVKNPHNVGLGANLCRCIEHAGGRWIWYLGDDDPIAEGALDAVKCAVRDFAAEIGEERCLGFNMSSNIYRHRQLLDVDSPEKYWAYMDEDFAFGNAVFLSSCVFRAEVCRSKLVDAYNYAGTTAPHIAVLSSALADGLVYRFLPLEVVKWGEPEEGHRWNRPMIVANFLNLWSVKGADAAIFRHLPKSIESFLWTPFIRGSAAMVFMDDLRSDGFWLCYYLRLCPYLRGRRLFTSICLSLLMLVMVIMPFTKPLFKKLLGPLIKRPVSSSEGLDRI